MIKKIIISILLILGFSYSESYAQIFDVLNKPMYEARVKLLDEFYARFNGKEQRKGVDVKYSDRKSNILMLLDFSRFKSREDSAFIFAESFVDKVVRDSIMANYTDSCWFAKVKCHGVLAKKGVDFLLYLSIEKRGKDMYKWVISDVEGGIFSTSRSIDHRELFLRPNDHEQSFASLVRTTEETSRYIDDFVKDGYESDALSIFLTLVRCGQLKIDYVSDVEFVYLQVPGYLFSVKHFERETMNAGWLISSIEKCDNERKAELLSRLHSVPSGETIVPNNGVIENVIDVVEQPKTPTTQNDSVITGATIAEKTVRRFWDNIRLWCETQDSDYRGKAIKECDKREFRVCDSLMIQFASQSGLPNADSYMLESYLRIFQSAIREGAVDIAIVDIKEIENTKDYSIISCTLHLTGAINTEVRDLFYIKNGKVLKITSTKASE